MEKKEGQVQVDKSLVAFGLLCKSLVAFAAIQVPLCKVDK